jgi:sugar lactone lactonase YvrE
MRSLSFEGSRPGSAQKWFLRSRTACGVCVAALLGVIGCSDNDDDGGTVALADSATLAELATQIGIPTTVAVSDGVAWVVESQFDRYAPLGGTGAPAPFRLVGVRLDGTGTDYEVISLPDGFFPEGITSAKDGRLFVGSVATGEIDTVDPGTAQSRIFSAALGPSTVGMTISTDGATLWACSSSLMAGTAGITGIDIATASPVASHRLDPAAGLTTAFCNDLVMSADGALWVTESAGGRIFKITSENLFTSNSAEVWLEDDKLKPPMPGQFGTNGITLLGGRLYTVNTDRSTLLKVDPSIEAPTGDDLEEVNLFSNRDDEAVTLVRPDGITAVPGSNTDILIVENGLQVNGGKKLLRARLDRL